MIPQQQHSSIMPIYRTGSLHSFIYDFDSFLSDVFPQFDKFLFCGDINIHLDEASKQSSDYGLYQQVNVPTHKAGHTLDVIISSQNHIQ